MYLYWRHGFPFRSHELPPPNYALSSGLLAYGGEYSGICFRKAYQRGIFPWPCPETDERGIIPWFCPRERFVLYPEELHISHSLKKTIKKHTFRICADRAFEEVIHACAEHHQEDGTWITPGMEKAFCELHEMGIAHSIESYVDDRLVGGFYGTCIGRIFGGESMFMREPDSAKAAFAVFVQRAVRYGIKLIDCQCPTENMARYGAREIPQSDYLGYIEAWREYELPAEIWEGDWEY